MTDDARRGCDGLVPYTRSQAYARVMWLEKTFEAKKCRGCSAWHVFRKAGS